MSDLGGDESALWTDDDPYSVYCIDPDEVARLAASSTIPLTKELECDVLGVIIEFCRSALLSWEGGKTPTKRLNECLQMVASGDLDEMIRATRLPEFPYIEHLLTEAVEHNEKISPFAIIVAARSMQRRAATLLRPAKRGRTVDVPVTRLLAGLDRLANRFEIHAGLGSNVNYSVDETEIDAPPPSERVSFIQHGVRIASDAGKRWNSKFGDDASAAKLSEYFSSVSAITARTIADRVREIRVGGQIDPKSGNFFA